MCFNILIIPYLLTNIWKYLHHFQGLAAFFWHDLGVIEREKKILKISVCNI